MSNPFDHDLAKLSQFTPSKDTFATAISMAANDGAGYRPFKVDFDPPYFLEVGKQYTMRLVDGEQQLWEIDPQLSLENDEAFIREARRAA